MSPRSDLNVIARFPSRVNFWPLVVWNRYFIGERIYIQGKTGDRNWNDFYDFHGFVCDVKIGGVFILLVLRGYEFQFRVDRNFWCHAPSKNEIPVEERPELCLVWGEDLINPNHLSLRLPV